MILFNLFLQNRDQATEVAGQLMSKFVHVHLHTGNLSYEERHDKLDMFISGHSKVLVTTNVLSLGVDGKNVKVVINFELPMNADASKVNISMYINRIGRCGRFGQQAIAVSFVKQEMAYELTKSLYDYNYDAEFIKV